MDRRDFVNRLAGFPFLFGAWKFQDGTGHDDGDALKLGFEQMKALGRPGLIFVLPHEPKERMALGRALFRLKAAKPAPAADAGHRIDFPGFIRLQRQSLALSASCVMICLEKEEARAGLGISAPRMVINSDRKVLRVLDEVPSPIEVDMVPRLNRLVQGPDLLHLKSRVKTLKAEMTPRRRNEVSALIKALSTAPAQQSHLYRSSSEFEAQQAKTQKWLGERPGISSWLALAALQLDYEKECALQALLESLQRPLPLGSVMPQFEMSGCLSYREVKPDDSEIPEGPMPACGMPSLSSLGGRFLRFVGDK